MWWIVAQRRRTTRNVFVSLQHRGPFRERVHLRPVADNIASCITRWCYRRSSHMEFAQNTKWSLSAGKAFFSSSTGSGCYPQIGSYLLAKLIQGNADWCRWFNFQNYKWECCVKAELKVYSFLSLLLYSFLCVSLPHHLFLLAVVCVTVLTVFAFFTIFCSLSFYLFRSFLSSILHHHHHHQPHCHHVPPLIWLNSSSLPPFRLSCRAPVTPSGVTRTVSDSRRTCYLVTRL